MGLVLSVALALALALLPVPVLARASLGASLAVALAFVWGRRLSARKRASAGGWVEVDADGVRRVNEAGSATLARWNSPFGVVVLCDPKRTRALFAFTTPEATRYLRVRVGVEPPAPAVRDMLLRASTVADWDILGDEGATEPALGAADALRLVAVLEKGTPGALDRVFLSDSRGALVVLDAHELRIGERTIDLGSALEWRGFMFHETLGHLTTMYQATWVKQGTQDPIVFVAQLPAEAPAWMVGKPTPLVGLDAALNRAIARDLRLMQSVPDLPPPREQRVAIERLFMLPLRRAFDRAPRQSRASVPSRGVPGGPSEPRA
jgi:hypothetical protein